MLTKKITTLLVLNILAILFATMIVVYKSQNCRDDSDRTTQIVECSNLYFQNQSSPTNPVHFGLDISNGLNQHFLFVYSKGTFQIGYSNSTLRISSQLDIYLSPFRLDLNLRPLG